jgi:hypothetical protein
MPASEPVFLPQPDGPRDHWRGFANAREGNGRSLIREWVQGGQVVRTEVVRTELFMRPWGGR